MKMSRLSRLGFGGMISIAILALGLFSRTSSVRASSCSISTDTTINQAYIDTNTCNTISISGTTTITGPAQQISSVLARLP